MKKISVLLFAIVFAQSAFSQMSFSINATLGQGTINCITPTLVYAASSNYSAPINYSWCSATTTLTGATVSITQPGNYTVTGVSGTFTASMPFPVQVNTTVPVSSGQMSFVVSGSGPPTTYTFVAISPTINITHYIYSPFGGTFTANSYSVVYVPGGPGIYWHCLMNDANGCATCYNGPGGPYTPGSPGTTTVTGIQDLTPLTELNITPNPGTGLFQISAHDEDLSIDVYALNGQHIKSVKVRSGVTQLDITELSAGTYLLKADSDNQIYRPTKIIKE